MDNFPATSTHKSSSYSNLVRLICLENPPVTVEILPGDGHEWLQDATSNVHSPFIFINGNLGVPQKVLYRVYLAAVAIFKSARRGGDSMIDDIAASSSILLLANPAHQSALNSRKKLVQKGILDVERELAFTAALLSPREGAKQSILWHHRHWLLHLLYGQNADRTLDRFLANSNEGPVDHMSVPSEVLQRELAIVSRACEVYPRNYYAWTYKHLCLKPSVLRLSLLWETSHSTTLNTSTILEELVSLRQWVEQHVSDHSAVHCLCNLTEQLSGFKRCSHDDPSDGSFSAAPRSCCQNFIPPVTHALSLVQLYPSHESLWMYLRRAVCMGDELENIKEIAPVVKECFCAWAAGTELSFSVSDQAVVSLQATRFLKWARLRGYSFVESETLRMGASHSGAYDVS